MILILGTMLLGTFIGGLSLQKSAEEKPPKEETVVPVPDEPEKIPESYLGTFNDSFGVPEEIRKPVIDYLNAYFRSIYTLEKQDTSLYFDNELAAAVSDKAIQLICETRKLYDYDFRLTDAKYDLTVTDFSQENGEYHLSLLENDKMSFSCLPGISSYVYDIETYLTIRQSEEQYKIHDLDKEQGYFLAFHDCETVEETEKTYGNFYHELKDMISYQQDVLSRKPIPAAAKTYSNHYDRTAAVNYLEQYCHERNPEWFNYTTTGGNCQNYASQALLAGGIPMDHYGEEQWKFYSSEGPYDVEVDETEDASGRSRSWVNVGYFYDYCRDNEGSGLVAEVNANIYSAEPGDIVIVGNGGLAHTMMVSKVINGHILVDSNSIDMKDYPLDAFTYTNVVLIKILGYNEY